MEKTIRILIVDDHPVVRHGLRSMLELKPGIHVVGEAQNGEEAIYYAEKLKPDLILMDLVMPKKDGLEAITEILQQNPQARILVLTSFAKDERIIDALKMGATGYLLKETTPDELLKAIQETYVGETYIPYEIARRLVRAMSKSGRPSIETTLTKREVEVLQMASRGLTNSQIANELVVAEGTVRFHFSNILSKLHLSNRTQAVLFAVQQGWVKVDTN